MAGKGKNKIKIPKQPKRVDNKANEPTRKRTRSNSQMDAATVAVVNKSPRGIPPAKLVKITVRDTVAKKIHFDSEQNVTQSINNNATPSTSVAEGVSVKMSAKGAKAHKLQNLGKDVSIALPNKSNWLKQMKLLMIQKW